MGEPRRFGRRAFLAGGVAVAAAAGGWFGLSRNPDIWRVPAVPDTRALLARKRRQAPSGTFRTEYGNPSPAADLTLDLRAARFVSYHDKDALTETGPFSDGSSEHQKNHRPIRFGYRTPAVRLAVVGGVVEGAQPVDLPWIRMKYGQRIQDQTDSWIDDGSPDDVDPYRRIVDNSNQDGDPRFYVAGGSWAVIDGMQVRNTHDGLGLYGAPGGSTGRFHVRNCYFQDVHDDAIENDEWQNVYVEDCLFERVYSWVSLRPSDERLEEMDQSPSVVQLRGCVVRMWPFPGGHRKRSTDRNHERILKIDSNSPRLMVRDCVVLAERFITPDSAELPERGRGKGGRVTDLYDNVTIVWAGSGPYPGNVPPGCRVTTDAGVYERAAADWKSRHGVREFGSGDVTRLIEPSPRHSESE